MTDLDTRIVVAPARSSRPRIAPLLAIGLLGGFALGVAARAWMRLIADDPEFSWSGTIFIVGAFTIFGFAQSVAAVVRARARRRWTSTIARVVGVIALMPLFVGAGSIMLPTVVGGGLAVARKDWRKVVRAICVLAAAGPVLLVISQIIGEFGWSLHSLAGVVAFVAIYGIIIRVTRFTMAPQEDGWRLSRKVKVPAFVIMALFLTYALVGVVG